MTIISLGWRPVPFPLAANLHRMDWFLLTIPFLPRISSFYSGRLLLYDIKSLSVFLLNLEYIGGDGQSVLKDDTTKTRDPYL
jgi:hypothetical protein